MSSIDLYYLDSNAWIFFGRNALAHKNLVRSHLTGSLKVVVSQQNIYELLDETRVSREHREANKRILTPFMGAVIEDSVFILGASKINSAQITNDVGSKVFEDHINPKKLSIRGIRDGIHLSNAGGADAFLVSCDRQVQKSAVDHQIPILCVKEFAARAALGVDLRCSSCGS